MSGDQMLRSIFGTKRGNERRRKKMTQATWKALQFARCQPNIIRVIKSEVYVKVGGKHYCSSEPGV